MERPNFIDFAKAIVIYLVILGHYTYAMDIPFDGEASWKLARLVTLFHMPFFFIASGMLYKRTDLRTTFKKGVKQLMIPYLIMCGICVALYIPITVISGSFHPMDIVRMVIAIGTGFDCRYAISLPCGALWFCYALFFIKLLKSLSYDNEVISYRGG